MPDLFPTFTMPTVVETAPSTALPEYPQSWLWDFETGDYARDGNGRVIIADGLTAWTQWCIKAVIAERFAFLAYSTDYGAEKEAAMKQPTRAGIEAELERTITEALIIDLRTESVVDFSFSFEGDAAHATFTVIPVVGDPQRLEVKLNG